MIQTNDLKKKSMSGFSVLEQKVTKARDALDSARLT